MESKLLDSLKGRRIVPYDDILHALQISDAAMEELVIHSIYDGLLCGRLDQQNRLLLVESCSGGAFDKDLSAAVLGRWKQNVNALLAEMSVE